MFVFAMLIAQVIVFLHFETPNFHICGNIFIYFMFIHLSNTYLEWLMKWLEARVVQIFDSWKCLIPFNLLHETLMNKHICQILEGMYLIFQRNPFPSMWQMFKIFIPTCHMEGNGYICFFSFFFSFPFTYQLGTWAIKVSNVWRTIITFFWNTLAIWSIPTCTISCENKNTHFKIGLNFYVWASI